MLSSTYISKISRINLGCPLKFSKLDQSGNFSCFENKSGSEKLPSAKAGFVQAKSKVGLPNHFIKGHN